jgi:hypothetical protein
VLVAIPDAPAAASLNSSAAGFPPQFLPAGRSEHTQMMDRGTAVRAALKAGVLGFFIGMIPFLGMVLTGALAVYFYRRENGVALPAALGSRLGGAAGIVSFAINAALITIRIFVFHAQQEYLDTMLKVSQAFGVNISDPDFQTAIHSLLTPSGLAVTFFFGMIFMVILACLGGALGSLFLRPSKTRE